MGDNPAWTAKLRDRPQLMPTGAHISWISATPPPEVILRLTCAPANPLNRLGPLPVTRAAARSAAGYGRYLSERIAGCERQMCELFKKYAAQGWR
jgi:hypothetical protein